MDNKYKIPGYTPDEIKKHIDDMKAQGYEVPSWYSPDMPSFFSHETMKIMNPKIEEAIDFSFPKKHYGEDILIYEAWGMRSLLEQAAMIGYYLAKIEEEKNKEKQ